MYLNYRRQSHRRLLHERSHSSQDSRICRPSMVEGYSKSQHYHKFSHVSELSPSANLWSGPISGSLDRYARISLGIFGRFPLEDCKVYYQDLKTTIKWVVSDSELYCILTLTVFSEVESKIDG